MELNQRIRYARTSLGWTQVQFAEKVGVSRIAVVLWEGGKTVPTHRHMVAISAATGMPVGVLDGSVVQLSDSRLTAPAPKPTPISGELDAARQQILLLQSERSRLLSELGLARAKGKWRRIMDTLSGVGATLAAVVALFVFTR